MSTDPTSLVADRELAAIRARLAAAEPDLLADLARLVNVDCGSYTRDGVNEVAAWTADFLARLGGEVTRHADPAGALGDTVEAVFRGASGVRGRCSSGTPTRSSRSARSPNARSGSRTVSRPAQG
jgi:hypothetical protein